MVEKQRKLTKVTMEYDNGDKEYIEGYETKMWLDALNGAIMNDVIHGGMSQGMLKGVTWKKVLINE